MTSIERIHDPMAEEWWEPASEVIRFDFNTTELMIRAGIPPDTSYEANDRYYALLNGLTDDTGGVAKLRATGYRYGPAAGDLDPAFIDLVNTGLTLAEAAGLTAAIIGWLRRIGATEIRVSERGVEALAKWELSRRGYGDAPEALSISRSPGQEQPRWGGRRKLGDYVVVLRLEDGGLATLRLSVDGILQELSVPEGREGGG